MLKPGDVISYFQMCAEEGANLRRGMNFRLRQRQSVVLMSVRSGAPYKDRIEENGKVLIYEGHDNPKPSNGKKPKEVDQESKNPDGSLTQNGCFYEAAKNHKESKTAPEIVKVYEKLRPGIWVYNGLFNLVDSWQEEQEGRKVFKFRLELIDDVDTPTIERKNIDHTRIMPSSVKLEVWKRDGGKCVKCGSTDNLHFDHIIPYSKGGSSLIADNIQLMCARHNLEKRDKIE